MRPALMPFAALCLAAAPALTAAAAPDCAVDHVAVATRLAELEGYYPRVMSDIDCAAPQGFAATAICASRDTGDLTLWQMARLDQLAWVYAVENATATAADQADPPRDSAFEARRDACRDGACLCAALIGHTNDSLGGTSPYPSP